MLVAAFALLPIALAAQTAAWAEEGIASWYGAEFQGRATASGESFDTTQFTAAHRTLPFGTRVVVTNLATGASTTVRINDRGPFVAGRIIDLSQAGARSIDVVATGTARVRLSLPQAGSPAASAAAVTTASPVATTVIPSAIAATPNPAPVQTPGIPETRTIQIAAFSSQVNARNLLDSLNANGLNAILEAVPGNGTWRVVLASVQLGNVDATVDRLRTLGISRVLVRKQ